MSALSELCRQMASCQACGLAQQRNKMVPGEGAEDADLLLIGEAPGFNEDQQGRPFVGAAGGFLDDLLRSIGLTRSDVYIANVIKCRPPGNRDPVPSEITSCRKWLDRQIDIINPRMIVTLGRYSMAMFFPGESIGKIHGTHQNHNNVIYFAMYHPAAALHQQSLRQTIKEDMLRIPELLKQTQTKSQKTTETQQLSMF